MGVFINEVLFDLFSRELDTLSLWAHTLFSRTALTAVCRNVHIDVSSVKTLQSYGYSRASLSWPLTLYLTM